MAKDGLSPLLCAAVLLGALTAARAGEDAHSRITTTLAVQTALEQGRRHLLRGEYDRAVQVLEAQIARIDGNREYLIALRDAYRGHIKSLQLAGRDAEAALYNRRLAILDRGPALEPGKKAAAPVPQPTKVRAKGDTPPAGPAVAAAASVQDPFHERNHRRLAEARELLRRADEEYRGERYAKAGQLYALAHQAVPDVLRDAGERWAYCRLHSVVERLNRKERPADAAELDRLEKEVHAAVGMTSKLKDFGQNLLTAIQARRAAGARRAEVPAVKVKHSQPQGSAWALAETNNFRIFHNQDNAYAERVAQVAELTRAAVQKKWFGQAEEVWSPRCDIYLHADGQAYSQATRKAATSPGHATITRQRSSSRILSRRIDLRVDELTLLNAVLPHETTHVVLAGRFGSHDLPRWADEGMAVLSEPRDRVERHLRLLGQYRQAGRFFTLANLMKYQDAWPERDSISAFYAQSVSLVEFLCRQKGPQAFARFMADALQGGYDAALRTHYGIQGTQDLEQRWLAFAFGTGNDYAQR